jgi:hypothetical protein
VATEDGAEVRTGPSLQPNELFAMMEEVFCMSGVDEEIEVVERVYAG